MPDHLLRLKQLLDSYLHDTIDPDDLNELWQLMEKLPEADLVDLQIAGFWNDPAPGRENRVDWERVYSRLQDKMHEPHIDYTRLLRPRRGRWKLLAIALQSKVDVKEVLVWKTILDFDNKTVGEAAAIISNYFGVEIQFDNEALRSCRFTADLRENENDLAQVMNVITLLTGSTWAKDGNTVRISGKGCD